MPAAIRVVVDLGNSRMKWGLVAPDGTLGETIATPLDQPDAWEALVGRWSRGAGIDWAISSVNPPVAHQLSRLVERTAKAEPVWFRSAASVPVRHALATPETTGADRALAIAFLQAEMARPTPFTLISCGTAITVEHIDARGIWQGGAITAGFGLLSRSLHLGTAQLPEVVWGGVEPPDAWGDSTRPAVLAGVYWGVIGAVRELLGHQTAAFPDSPRFWTGGDAEAIASHMGGANSTIEPNLVLKALARFGFPGP